VGRYGEFAAPNGSHHPHQIPLRSLAIGLQCGWSAGRIPHDFRRTAVRNLERAGVSRSVAMKLTGHKTEAVYRRYAIVSEADLHEAVSKLARLVHDAGTKTGTADASVGTRVRRKLAEGEGFEPPRASRPGGFQVRTASPFTMS